MENSMKVLLASTLTVLFGTFSMVAVADPDKPRVFQTSPVWNGASGVEIGAAWLKRSKDRVDGRIMTTVDVGGAPYTAWWVVFNNPAGCTVVIEDERESGPCGPDSFFDGGEAAGAAVFYGSSAISASDGMGKGVINFDLSAVGGEGAGNGSQMPPPPAKNAPPWNRVLHKNNARCAEIHLDINQHPDLGTPIDWVGELTYPEKGHSFAIFLPAKGCK
jgi:hypothetical protein